MNMTSQVRVTTGC